MQQITGKTSLTGLLGSPVDHSISPLMHNFSFQHLGIDWVYLCFDVKEEGLEDAVKGLRALHDYSAGHGYIAGGAAYNYIIFRKFGKCLFEFV